MLRRYPVAVGFTIAFAAWAGAGVSGAGRRGSHEESPPPGPACTRPATRPAATCGPRRGGGASRCRHCPEVLARLLRSGPARDRLRAAAARHRHRPAGSEPRAAAPLDAAAPLPYPVEGASILKPRNMAKPVIGIIGNAHLINDEYPVQAVGVSNIEAVADADRRDPADGAGAAQGRARSPT